MECPEVQSSPHWRTSPGRSATRWPGNLLRSTCGNRPTSGPRMNSVNARSAAGRLEKNQMNLASLQPREETSNGNNASPIAPDVGGLFFPQNQTLGIDLSGFSPRVQQKITHAGVNSSSYQQASRDLAKLADLKIAPKPVERLVHKIGQERIDQRDADTAAHDQLPLMSKDTVANPDRSSPKVAMVSIDGGRLQIRPESDKPKQDSHWRESKVAVLETYLSDIQLEDPDPDVPRCFLDLNRTKEMIRGLGHALPVGLEFTGENAKREPDEADGMNRKKGGRSVRPGRPERVVRSVLASRKCSDEFGPMVHQAAWERNFFGADRQAFLGDGLPVNWTIWARHFGSFTPILDFVHALSYIFAAAFAGRSQAEGEEVYKRWIQEVWSGQVGSILVELEQRLLVLGIAPEGSAESDPRRLVFEASRYLKNNAGRMRYDEYRRQGLPIMTSAVESVIKMLNKRVKGSEKFWSEPGAEAILQLQADHLSETETMSRFWLEREAKASGHRPYLQAA